MTRAEQRTADLARLNSRISELVAKLEERLAALFPGRVERFSGNRGLYIGAQDENVSARFSISYGYGYGSEPTGIKAEVSAPYHVRIRSVSYRAKGDKLEFNLDKIIERVKICVEAVTEKQRQKEKQDMARRVNHAALKSEMGDYPVSSETLRYTHGVTYCRGFDGTYDLTVQRTLPLAKLRRVLDALWEIDKPI